MTWWMGKWLETVGNLNGVSVNLSMRGTDSRSRNPISDNLERCRASKFADGDYHYPLLAPFASDSFYTLRDEIHPADP